MPFGNLFVWQWKLHISHWVHYTYPEYIYISAVQRFVNENIVFNIRERVYQNIRGGSDIDKNNLFTLFIVPYMKSRYILCYEME